MGSPLWCTVPAPPPLTRTEDTCSCCGSERVFELQLMPGLLSYIPKKIASTIREEVELESPASESILESNSPSKAQMDIFLQDIDDGIDFGVVGVWTCSSSCSEGIEEVLRVQGPSDIAY